MLMIIQAVTAEALGKARAMFEEYAAEWPGDDLVDERFADELTNLPGDYAPPAGRLLVALYDGDPAGCIALKKLSKDVCEMKRLYVRPQFRNFQIGRRLAENLIGEAWQMGYASLRLDTPRSMVQAKRLYESLGFREIRSYNGKSGEKNIFMELLLS